MGKKAERGELHGTEKEIARCSVPAIPHGTLNIYDVSKEKEMFSSWQH
jgi:hypothetical protein